MKPILVTVLVWIISHTPLVAQDFNKGVRAYNSGDYASAITEWLPLAEQGDATSQFNLGIMYAYGAGVSKDYAEAAKWYTFAAKQGSALAQQNLGLLYRNGQGVSRNPRLVAEWYRRAAEQGQVIAQNNLAVSYEVGEGLPKDSVRSYMWYEIASKNGYEEATKYRNEISQKMTSVDISEAQKMAKECMDSNYQNCGW